MPILMLVIDAIAVGGCAATSTRTIPDYFNIQNISQMVIVHTPRGDGDRQTATAIVTDRETLDAVLILLRKIPAQGSVFKKFPKDIERWEILLQEGDTTVGNLEFVGICLRAPDVTNGTFCSGSTDDQERLLDAIVRAFSKTR